ncbi:ML domain-containing protein [Mycena chlorophos]|uniref:Phosphatidylglycerol/phosphatidylinositol transfer protein n=1 Tax=Mycena chlorophos TaxID=658473 RepID=A0A8H6WIB6_MYCCL|nr:ML domain-containing protein [Mycena chlorophos]
MHFPALLLTALASIGGVRGGIDYAFSREAWITSPGAPQFRMQELKTTANWEYIDCGLDTDMVQLESFRISPDPPVPGQNLTVNVVGIAREPIKNGAYADVTVKLGLVKLPPKRFDVCEEAKNAKAEIQCPVEPGRYEVEQTVTLPKEIPPAKFVVTVRGYGAEDQDMLCLDLVADFRLGKVQA